MRVGSAHSIISVYEAVGRSARPKRRVLRKIFAGRADIEPLGILLERFEQLIEPTFVVAMFERSRPAAELLHVIAHRGDAAGMRTKHFVQPRHHFIDGLPRNQIAQGFLAGDDANRLAFVFRDVIAEQFVLFESRRKKMNVVEHRVRRRPP